MHTVRGGQDHQEQANVRGLRPQHEGQPALRRYGVCRMRRRHSRGRGIHHVRSVYAWSIRERNGS